MKKYLNIALICFILFSCERKTEKVFIPFIQKQRQIDTSFIKNVNIDSIVLGYTTKTDLQNSDYKFTEINLNQIKKLFAEYSREGEHFYVDSFNQILIGTYAETEIISAVWLLKYFKGKLLGKTIDLNNYKVKNMISDFPNFKWSTTGEATFWFYKNNINFDTTIFFVKVDPKIEKFPLNVEYYLEKPIEGVKIEMSAWKIYGPEYGMLDTILIKPLYSPLEKTHSNYYLYHRKPGLKTTMRELSTWGKKSIYEEIKIGVWQVYNADHTLKCIEYYNNGQLIKTENTPHNTQYSQ